MLSINAEDLTVTVQPGVTRKQLNEAVKRTGLFFPIDPVADATLGGMSATRASGTNAVRYGTMRENVLALQVVTASGEIIRTGTRAKKSSAGYDLTRLMVGSEGTLGVITEVTVRLYPLPVSAAICSFPSIKAAVRTTIQIIQLGIPIAWVELIDATTVRMVNAHSTLTLREEPLLRSRDFRAGPRTCLPETELDKVFEPFYRVENSRSRDTGGSGLGLAIVRQIARSHGGDVVLNNRGKGGLRAVLRLRSG